MKLRLKSLLVIGLTTIGLQAVLYLLASAVLLNGYAEMESDLIHRDLERVQRALQDDLAGLELISEDWAKWDDSYAFVAGENPTFVEQNLSEATINYMRTQLLMMINDRGEVVLSRSYEGEDLHERPLQAGVMEAVKGGLFAPAAVKEKGRSGLVLLPEGPMLIAAQPILPSVGKGVPRGALVLGRTLDATTVEHLGERTRLSISFIPLEGGAGPADALEARRMLSPQARARVTPLSDKQVAGYSLIDDLSGRPILMARVVEPRTVYERGQESRRILMASLGVLSLAFTGILLGLIERLVVSRITRLSAEVNRVGSSGDTAARVEAGGRDEIGRLATDINGMLEAIERLRAQEHSYVEKIEAEQQRGEKLLLNVLPRPIAERLKRTPGTIADSFSEVSVLFADLVGFTRMASQRSPIEVVDLLNRVFSEFDQLSERHGLLKIKTIGDAYMVVSGLPAYRPDHAAALAEMALDMQHAVRHLSVELGRPLSLRIGIHSGPVAAGVIGLTRFSYDLWGDTVNLASRMESHGLAGCIQVTSVTMAHLEANYRLDRRDEIQVKGIGRMETWLLIDRRPEVREEAATGASPGSGKELERRDGPIIVRNVPARVPVVLEPGARRSGLTLP